MCIFVTKRKKKRLVEKWINEHQERQYYIARNGMIGDATGPMGPGRYTAIEDFYETIVKNWKD